MLKSLTENQQSRTFYPNTDRTFNRDNTKNYIINLHLNTNSIYKNIKDPSPIKMDSRAFNIALNNNSIKKKLISELQNHNIDIVDGDISRGYFSLAADIGENQILHISFPKDSIKNHQRFYEPEILQPLATLYKDSELKIEVLPKVKTKGITEEHVNSLVSSLAKKGLLFVDPRENVGLININDKEIPVVIGDGSVTKINGNKVEPFVSSRDKNNTVLFFNREMNNLYHSLSRKCLNEEEIEQSKEILDFFKKNQNYTKYDWGERENPKTWAQNKYIEKLGLKKDDGSGRYYPKGIIDHDTLSQLNQQKSPKHPIAGKFVDMVTDHNLRTQDARKVAALEIADIVNERGGDKEGFMKFIDEHKKNTRKQR